jgi:hypothetical protein
MSKTNKKKTFNKVSAVKSNARDRVGMPKSSFVIQPKNEKIPRFKKSWRDYCIENDMEEDDINE